MHPDILDAIRPRFILDAFAVVGGAAVPLNEAQARKFSQIEQAEEIVAMLPSGVTDAKIVHGGVDPEFGDLRSNTQTDDEPDGFYILVLQCTVTIPSKDPQQPPRTGPMSYNIGEILSQRMLLGDARHTAGLVLDEIGQLHFRLPA